MFLPDRIALAALDTNSNLAAFLVEDGCEGSWIVKTKSGYAAQLAADASGGMYLPSIFDSDKALVRHFEGFINPSWFGWSESKTGSQNKAALAECLAVASVSRERTIRMNAGEFDFDGGVEIPKHVTLLGQGGWGELGHPGPTRISLNTEGYGFLGRQYSRIEGLDFVAGAGYTPSVAVMCGGRGMTVGPNGYRGAIECCVDVGSQPVNLNATKILGGYASGVVDGVRVKQYKDGTMWTNGTAFAVGAIRRCNTTWVDYRCATDHTSPSSGSFAADRSANPSRWAEATHAYGAADDHTSELGPFDIIGATGVAFGFYNASGWQINNPKAQNCTGYGFIFEHEARGNKGMVYAEANGVDLYCGTRTHGNEIDICPMVHFPTIQYAPGARDNNRIRTYKEVSGIKQWTVV